MANVKVPPFTEAPETVVGGTPQSEFPFDFPFWSTSDILVYVDDELIEAADYTVTGLAIQSSEAVEGGYGSGTVTFDVAVSNCTVTIDRRVVGDRQTQFQRNIPLSMPALNGDLNRLTARQQDLERQKVTRPVGDRAGLYLAFDADGNEVPSAGTGSDPALRTDLAALPGASLINFDPGITGSAGWTVQAALRALPVMPAAVGSLASATLTTATLLRALTYAMANKRPVELSGAYTINGPITPTTAVEGAELHITLRDVVTITVDPAATAFNRVFYAESTTVKSHSVSGGGTLTIDCNNKAAVGFWLRHTAAETGGSILFNAPVHVKNLKAATGVTNAAGILILGRYERIVLRSPTVEDVTRTDASGECSGITCSGFDGEVEIYSPVVRRVNYGTLGSADADCIKCFGRNAGSTNSRREGSVRIFNPVMENGQTRLYKDQCGDTVIFSPLARRRAVDDGLGGAVLGTQSGAGSVDFDFQFGGGLVLDAHIEYYKSVLGVSPFSGSHSIFAFQQLVDNSEMYAAARNATLITDVAITRAVQVAEGGSRSTTEITGLKVIPVSGMTTTVFADAVVEINAAQILAKTTETIINVTGVDAPNTNPVIGYRGYLGSTLTDFVTKLSVKVNNCSTSLAISGQATRAISDIAGNHIKAYKSMEIGDNPGYRNWYADMDVCLKKLRAGTKISIYLDNSSFLDTDWATPVTVPWGTTGTLYLQANGISNTNTAATDINLEARLDAAAPNAWHSHDGGINWRVLN